LWRSSATNTVEIRAVGEPVGPKLDSFHFIDYLAGGIAQHWGLEPRACQPYRAQPKATSSPGKYVRCNVMRGRVFRDLEDFNEQWRVWLVEFAAVRVHGTTHERPIDRFAGEVAGLAQRSRRRCAEAAS
jgi:hypothetical protein